MLKYFKSLIDDVLADQKPTGLSEEEVQVACAALLVHCAKADGHKSDVEDAKLREVLADRFSLTEADVRALIEDAERREADAGDLHKFTWVVHQNLDGVGRFDIVRLLWEISHADAKIDHEEKAAVNLVASMLDVELADAVALRRRVEGRD